MTMAEDIDHQPGLILPPGPAGAWDEARVSGPRVLRESNGRWRMWYYGRDRAFGPDIPLPTGRIGLAESDDGVHWTRVPGPMTGGAVLDPHPDRERFDSAHIGASDIQHEGDGRLRLWYFGGDHEQMRIGPFRVRGLRLRPGCAVSDDGLNWQRIDGRFRGALLDAGPPGSFDNAGCAFPQVVQGPGDIQRMYYHSLDPARMVFSVGVAESRDGMHWQRRGEVLGPGEPGAFDAIGAGSRHVIRYRFDGRERWLMLYEGVTSEHHSIGLAVSDDGLTWTRVPGPEPDGSVLAHAPSGSGRWDARAVGTPWVVPLPDGRLHLYYVGCDETPGGITDELGMKQQIGLAISDGDPRRWERWSP